MDDYKRSLYMYAQRMIASDEVCCTCYALEEVLFREGGDSYCGDSYCGDSYCGDSYHDDTHLEVFTEFMGLFDGRYWGRRVDYLLKDSDDLWWEPRWKEPRIRALDCILRD